MKKRKTDEQIIGFLKQPATAAVLLMFDEPDYHQARREVEEVLARASVVR